MSRPDCAPARVDAAVGLALRRALGDAGPVDPGRPLRAVVGLSGGCDSMLLLDTLARLAPPLPICVAARSEHAVRAGQVNESRIADERMPVDARFELPCQ